MADLGVFEVTLIGGEAYLREDWLTLVSAIRDRGMQCTMTSGGRGFTSERAVAAKAAGLLGVSISVDGNEASHDHLRGVAGSYQSALSAMAAARSAGLAVSCNTQINRLTLPHLSGLLEVLGTMGIQAWQYQITVPMGRAADEPEILLQPYDMLEAVPLMARLKPRATALGIRLWNGNNVGYFGPHEEALRGIGGRSHGGSCGAGRITLGIEANGAIKGCPSLTSREWTGGNIGDAKLVDIWERSSRLRYTRDRTVADLWGYCATCYYADECRAGCTWAASVTLGRPGNNPYCHHRALEMQRKGVRERLVATQEAPGEPFDNGVFTIVEEPWPGTPLDAFSLEPSAAVPEARSLFP